MFALWQRLRVPLPLEVFTGRCNVVHSPDFVSPPHRSGADVITVHDLSFLVVPECAEPKWQPSWAKRFRSRAPR